MSQLLSNPIMDGLDFLQDERMANVRWLWDDDDEEGDTRIATPHRRLSPTKTMDSWTFERHIPNQIVTKRKDYKSPEFAAFVEMGVEQDVAYQERGGRRMSLPHRPPPLFIPPPPAAHHQPRQQQHPASAPVLLDPASPLSHIASRRFSLPPTLSLANANTGASQPHQPGWTRAAKQFLDHIEIQAPARQDELRKRIDMFVAERGLNSFKREELSTDKARYFVIKSHTPSNIHLSLRHSTWSSTPYGHRRLHQAYTSTHPSPIYLFFSANGSGRFCGVAIMSSGVVEDGPRRMQWDGGEWQGGFSARWIYVKDVLNGSVKDLRVPANENKSVAQSRDTQELPAEVGSSLLDLFASMLFSSSMLSDMFREDTVEPPNSSSCVATAAAAAAAAAAVDGRLRDRRFSLPFC